MAQEFENALSEAGANYLQASLAGAASIEIKIGYMTREYEHYPIWRNLRQVADKIAMWRQDSYPQTTLTYRSFMRGALFGLHVAHQFMPAEARDEFFEDGIELPTEPEHPVAELMQHADVGWEMTRGHYTALFDQLQDKICDDPEYLPALRLGFGYVISMMHGSYEAYKRMNIAWLAVHDTDWDQGMIDELESGTQETS